MDYAISSDVLFSTSVISAAVLMVILYIAGLWRVFVKAGQSGWGVLIPIYNYFCMFEIAWGNGLWFLLMFIPMINTIVCMMLFVKLAESFGKGYLFGIGLILLPPIFICILGFGASEYIGPRYSRV